MKVYFLKCTSTYTLPIPMKLKYILNIIKKFSPAIFYPTCFPFNRFVALSDNNYFLDGPEGAVRVKEEGLEKEFEGIICVQSR